MPLKEIMAFDPYAWAAMVTKMGQQGMAMEAIKAGAVDFVVRPFKPYRVKTALDKLLD